MCFARAFAIVTPSRLRQAIISWFGRYCWPEVRSDLRWSGLRANNSEIPIPRSVFQERLDRLRITYSQDNFPTPHDNPPPNQLCLPTQLGKSPHSRAMNMFPRPLGTSLMRRLNLIHHLPNSIHQDRLQSDRLLTNRIYLFFLLLGEDVVLRGGLRLLCGGRCCAEGDVRKGRETGEGVSMWGVGV